MNFVGHRRAISTVITTVMMLTAVAVMGATLVAWSNGKLIVFESSLANSAANKTNTINENLVIENVSFCRNTLCAASPLPPFSTAMNITLTNTGTVSLKVTNIQINGSAPATTCDPLPFIVSRGQSYLWQCVNLLHSKSVNTITVTTSRGSIFTTQVAPL